MGLQLAAAVIAHHQVRLGGNRAAQEDVGIRKAGGAQPLRHGFNHRSGRAGREAGLDLDDLFIDVVGETLIRFRRHGGRGETGERHEAE